MKNKLQPVGKVV